VSEEREVKRGSDRYLRIGWDVEYSQDFLTGKAEFAVKGRDLHGPRKMP
jgi:hypothetical protein